MGQTDDMISFVRKSKKIIATDFFLYRFFFVVLNFLKEGIKAEAITRFFVWKRGLFYSNIYLDLICCLS